MKSKTKRLGPLNVKNTKQQKMDQRRENIYRQNRRQFSITDAEGFVTKWSVHLVDDRQVRLQHGTAPCRQGLHGCLQRRWMNYDEQ